MATLPRLAAAIVLVAAIAGCSRGSPAIGIEGPPTAVPSIQPSPASASASAPAKRPSVTIPATLVGDWTAAVSGTTASSGTWTLRADPGNLSLKNPVGGEFFTLDPTEFTDHGFTVPAAADCLDQTSVTDGRYRYVLA